MQSNKITRSSNVYLTLYPTTTDYNIHFDHNLAQGPAERLLHVKITLSIYITDFRLPESQ